MREKDFVLLIAEDNEDDVTLIRESLEEARMASEIHRVGDGEAALAFLRKEAGYAGAPTPDLVMLDIRMPRKNGFEVLTEMRSDPALKSIPTIMLTGLGEKSEVEEGFIRGANAYMTKPVSGGTLPEAVQVLLAEKKTSLKPLAPIEILIVEDNEDDVALLREAFIEAKIINGVHVVNTGDEAMEYLKRKGEYSEATLPGLIMLDINLPGKNGFELLEEIKSDETLRMIPVVMLTTSSRESDVRESYVKGACSYITKPVRFEEFQEAIRQFAIYWQKVVRLPARTPAAAR